MAEQRGTWLKKIVTVAIAGAALIAAIKALFEWVAGTPWWIIIGVAAIAGVIYAADVVYERYLIPRRHRILKATRQRESEAVERMAREATLSCAVCGHEYPRWFTSRISSPDPNRSTSALFPVCDRCMCGFEQPHLGEIHDEYLARMVFDCLRRKLRSRKE